MDIAELIEIALAGTDERRVEIAALEPADISKQVVSGLSQLIAELVDNAISFSEPTELVRITGLHDQADYLISIADRGVGVPEDLLSELNRVLATPGTETGPGPRLGISLVARLAARHDIAVRLVPGAPGTTARVTIPGRLVGDSERHADPAGGHRLPPRSTPTEDIFAAADEVEEMVDLTRFDPAYQGGGSGVFAMSEEAKREAEAFLEKVFAPLVERPGITERPAPRPPAYGEGSAPNADPRPEEPETVDQGGTVTALRVRVPGENFSLVEDDPSTIAAEGAIDIRSALLSYAEGRRSAREDGRRD